MQIKELKNLIKDIPDDVEVCVTDMNDTYFNFEVGTYHDKTQTYLDLIIPIYINSYFKEDDDECIIVS